MPLTPEDVRNKQFTTVRLREGYDEDEVDAFLDEVEAELTRLLRENEDLRAKLAAATRAAAQNQQNMRKPPEQQDQQQQQQQQGMRGPGGPVPAGISGPPQQQMGAPGGPPQLPSGAPQLPAGAAAGGAGGPQGPGPMRAGSGRPDGRPAWASPPAAADGWSDGQPHAAVAMRRQRSGRPGGDSAARVLSLAQQTADQAIAEADSEANKIVGEARACRGSGA
ncbi:Cell wall synthesis protein Wag31 [Streptomyces violarus]